MCLQHRSIKDSQGVDRGVAGTIEELADATLSAQPLTALSWSPDRTGPVLLRRAGPVPACRLRHQAAGSLTVEKGLLKHRHQLGLQDSEPVPVRSCSCSPFCHPSSTPRQSVPAASQLAEGQGLMSLKQHAIPAAMLQHPMCRDISHSMSVTSQLSANQAPPEAVGAIRISKNAYQHGLW